MADTIKLINKGKTSKTAPGQKAFFNGTQIKKIFFTEVAKSFNKYRVYQWDTTPPEIIIDNFGILDKNDSSIQATKDQSKVITGRVIDTESGVASLTVNGNTVKVENDGTFKVTCNFAVNAKTPIKLSAMDNVGNTSVVTKTALNDTNPPSVSVTTPASTSASRVYWIYATGNSSTTIKGSVSDAGSGVEKVIITDPAGKQTTASLSESTYSANVTVYPGSSKYTVTAYDRLGNSKSVNCYLSTSKYVLYVDPNGGTYDGVSAVTAYGFELNASGFEKTYNYTGSVQSFTVPYSGYYYIEACGSRGGDDGGYSGGKGGYVKGYKYLNAGEVIYIDIGEQGAGDSANVAQSSGNGKASCGGGTSGNGGGSTNIYTTLRGNGKLINYSNYRNEVLLVAGGGGGAGYPAVAGVGGECLYTYTSSNKSGIGVHIYGDNSKVISSSFAQGQDCPNDGGGGGGGWLGGQYGLDASLGSRAAGGGASFINAAAGCIVVGLTPSYCDGTGWVRFTYVTGSAALKVPTRPGHTFAGWSFSGNVASSKTDQYGFGTTMVTFNQGVSHAKALWA